MWTEVFRYEIKSKTGWKNIDKLSIVRIQFCVLEKDTVKRIKRRAIDWEKIFAKHIFDKDCYSKDQKENFKLNNVKTNSPSI